MTRTINKIRDDIIEVVETQTLTNVERFQKKTLLTEKKKLEEKIIEIDNLLNEF